MSGSRTRSGAKGRCRDDSHHTTKPERSPRMALRVSDERLILLISPIVIITIGIVVVIVIVIDVTVVNIVLTLNGRKNIVAPRIFLRIFFSHLIMY